MHGLVAIGDNDTFFIVPEKFLGEINTKEQSTTVQYNGAVYIVHKMNDSKEKDKLRGYKQNYILDYVLS